MDEGDLRSNIVREERPWGGFLRFTLNTPSTVKILTVKPMQSLSLQYHKHRSEFWHVISGSLTVTIAETVSEVQSGDEFFVKQGIEHSITGGKDGAQVLEIALGNFDEDDITRISDKYGRV